jgi:hypothetical protein
MPNEHVPIVTLHRQVGLLAPTQLLDIHQGLPRATSKSARCSFGAKLSLPRQTSFCSLSANLGFGFSGHDALYDLSVCADVTLGPGPVPEIGHQND